VRYDWDAPQKFDVTMWIASLEAAAAKKPDVLFPSCLDPAAGTPVIDQAAANGVPSLIFDNDCPDSSRLAFIGHPDNEADGRALADVLAAKVGGTGEVAVLIGSAGSLQHQQRTKGFVDQITTQYPDMKVVAQEADNDDMEQAANLTATILQAHPNLVGIYGADSVAPVGAARAIVEAGKVGQAFVVGQDDLAETVQFMRDGVVAGFYVQKQKNMGYWSVYYAWAYLNGHTIPAVHETGGFVVTPEMLEELYPLG
jgi:ribose transport system substrate-binding protein